MARTRRRTLLAWESARSDVMCVLFARLCHSHTGRKLPPRSSRDHTLWAQAIIKIMRVDMIVSCAMMMFALHSSSALPCDTPASSAPWRHVGPAGYETAGTMAKSFGAAQAMVKLGNGSSWLLATANGGIWKTPDLLGRNANGGPVWANVLDGQPVSCTSISAMQSLGDTVLAGCGGATSSEMGYDWMVSNGGDWAGLMLSNDGGETWKTVSYTHLTLPTKA